MKLVAQLKLLPDGQQADALRETLAAANTACTYASAVAHEHGLRSRFALQRLVYHDIRSRFGLSAQMTVRCIAKVADAYKVGRHTVCRTFGRFAAQPYDDRILRFCDDDTVSIRTLKGRIKVPYVCGDHQRKLMAQRKGEVDLVKQAKSWFLLATCDIPEPTVAVADDFVGVDLGIVNVAVDSDGECFSGESVEQQRQRHAHRQRNLQRKGTRAAKRKLRAVSGRQARYQRDVNHCISKAIVQKAERTGRGVALENLEGIRGRVTARRRQRARLANWSFFQLRSFVGYKAKLAGVLVVLVDPRNTSRECPECGHAERANRRSRERFACRSCGHAGPADHIAAQNIRARAAVNRPNGDREVSKVAGAGAVRCHVAQLRAPSFRAG